MTRYQPAGHTPCDQCPEVSPCHRSRIWSNVVQGIDCNLGRRKYIWANQSTHLRGSSDCTSTSFSKEATKASSHCCRQPSSFCRRRGGEERQRMSLQSYWHKSDLGWCDWCFSVQHQGKIPGNICCRAITFSDSEVTRAELVNTTWQKHSARGPVHVDQCTLTFC